MTPTFAFVTTLILDQRPPHPNINRLTPQRVNGYIQPDEARAARTFVSRRLDAKRLIFRT